MDTWTPVAGDDLFVDVDSNTGYLVHPNGDYLPFIVGSGQRRTVRYMGLTYFAGTPVKNWVVKEKKIQSDRSTFGPDGRFLRLFDKGVTRTAYGIHSTKYIENILSSEDRYKSFGCILVSVEILDIIETSYKANGETLNVKTMQGLQGLVDELNFREYVAEGA